MMNDLSKTLAILSSMIAPVVLIMASGSLILTTSQRLSRVIERTRKLTEYMRGLIQQDAKNEYVVEEAHALSGQLDKATRRARLLQRAMTCLYLTLSLFVATSIALGVTDISHLSQTWIPLVLGILGAILLFYSSILLIHESRIALTAVNEEMNYSIRFFNRHFPHIRKHPSKPIWKRLTAWIGSTTQGNDDVSQPE